eukprot:4667066-Pyramimonas_sp.AAC.1
MAALDAPLLLAYPALAEDLCEPLDHVQCAQALRELVALHPRRAHGHAFPHIVASLAGGGRILLPPLPPLPQDHHASKGIGNNCAERRGNMLPLLSAQLLPMPSPC